MEVTVHYPWVPPTCYHCHELGHIIRSCLLYTPPAADPPAAAGKRSNKTPAKSAKKAHPAVKVSQSTSTTSGPSKPSNQAQKAPDSVPRSSPKEGVSTNDSHCLATPSINQIVAAYHMDISTSSISTKHPPSLVLSTIKPFNPFSTPDPPRPSLKRSRSSPTLSPPQTSNPNPFIRPKATKKALPSTNTHPLSTTDHLQKTLSTTFSNSFALLDVPNLSGDPSNLL